MRNLDELFERLSRSKFRIRFKLKPADIEYIGKKGMAAIERHARDFITGRLAAAEPKNDGKQTLMRGHPVFIAQHATASCCRKCLFKWHGIARGKPLSNSEIDYIISVLMGWINNQIDICRPVV